MKRDQWNPNDKNGQQYKDTNYRKERNAFKHVSSFSSDRPYRWLIADHCTIVCQK